MAKRNGKRVSSDRDDWSRYNKFREENEKLRKEVSKLRKIVQDVLIDRLEKKQYRLDNNEPAIEPTCDRCGNTDLKKTTITRHDGKFELITCKSCKHRSELKKVKEKKS